MPLTCLCAAWFVKNAIEPTFDWVDIMYLLGVRNRVRYVRLAVLALFLIGVVALVRITRSHRSRKP